jgi:adenine specific DNA methylase Mod
MAGNRYPEAHKLILFVERAPFAAEEKTRLVELLNADGMTEETVEEVHKSLSAIPKDQFSDDWQHAKFVMDLNGIFKQWQLTHGSKNFKHSR